MCSDCYLRCPKICGLVLLIEGKCFEGWRVWGTLWKEVLLYIDFFCIQNASRTCVWLHFGLDLNCHSDAVCASRGNGGASLLFAASNGAATLTCFLPRFGIATRNIQNNFWQCLGLAARHKSGDMCSVTSKYNWKECYGDNILLSGGQHNMTAVWAVYLCPASTSFTWHGYCTFVKHPGTLLPRCMLCRALDRKHRQMGFFWFIIIITFFFFFLLEPWATVWHFCRLVWMDLLKNR